MSPYWVIVGYNEVAMYLMRCAMFLKRIGRWLFLGSAFFMVGWLLGQKTRAARIWLQANGY